MGTLGYVSLGCGVAPSIGRGKRHKGKMEKGKKEKGEMGNVEKWQKGKSENKLGLSCAKLSSSWGQ